jgi:hypothetical protein
MKPLYVPLWDNLASFEPEPADETRPWIWKGRGRNLAIIAGSYCLLFGVLFVLYL